MPRADRYLRTSLFVVRYPGGYVLVHPGSSVILVTDALGARVVKRLILGQSEQMVRGWVEARRDACVGERVQRLVDRLDTIGAITTETPRRSFRWRMRSWLSLAVGQVLTLASVMVPLLPVALLRLSLDALPFTPVVARTLAQIRPYVDANLRASGYAYTSERWRDGIARACAAANARSFFFMYLALVLAPSKLHRLLYSLYDMESFGELPRTLHATGGGVVAGLHTSLYVGIIPLLDASKWECAVLADVTALGANVGDDATPGLEGYSRHATILSSHSRMAGKVLLERLRAGQVAVLAFDAPPQDASPGAILPSVTLLNRTVCRFDGPAWLAARSGKPIVFVSTYQQGRKTMVHVQPPLYARSDVPRQAQVEDLTARLYAAAEAFVRKHPEAWLAWCYQHDLVVPGEGLGKHGEIEDEIALAPT